MLLVLAMIGWALAVGLTGRRLTAGRQMLLLAGVAAIIAAQAALFGPS